MSVRPLSTVKFQCAQKLVIEGVNLELQDQRCVRFLVGTTLLVRTRKSIQPSLVIRWLVLNRSSQVLVPFPCAIVFARVCQMRVDFFRCATPELLA